MAPRNPRKGTGRKRGEGSIYPRRKNGKVVGYEVAVVVNGRTIRRLAPDAASAEALRKKLVADRDAGVDVVGGEQTVTTWANTWYEQKARVLKPRTLDGYRSQLEIYVLPVIGSRRLREVHADMLQQLINHIQDDIAAHTRHRGARTAVAVGNLLDRVFDMAERRGLIARNPMDGVELPSYKAPRVTPPTDAQLAAVLAAAAASRTPPLWYLYGLLGLRRGEGIGLRWGDVDLDAGTITIRQQIQATAAQGVYVGTPKSEASERTLPLPPAAVEQLRSWRSVVAARQLRARGWQNNDLVFPGKAGRPMWPTAVDAAWRQLRAAAGLPETVRLHHLRHMVATLLDEAGATQALKADILGHEQTNITARYTHGRLAAMRRVLETVAERVLRRTA